MRAIADSVGAVLMVDMAHFPGLVAGGVFTGDYSPFPHAHVVTTTTHKTLRGPRAGMVLSTAEFADALDKSCPLMMGGPLPHVVAAKAVALREARSEEFKTYAHRIVSNAQALATACTAHGLEVVTGGTDNHLLLVNVASLGLTGRQAEGALHECGITLNRNALPYDQNGPWYTSGLRIGTPAVTTLGMEPEEMREIASVISLVLKATRPQNAPDGTGQGEIPGGRRGEVRGAAEGQSPAGPLPRLSRAGPRVPEKGFLRVTGEDARESLIDESDRGVHHARAGRAEDHLVSSFQASIVLRHVYAHGYARGNDIAEIRKYLGVHLFSGEHVRLACREIRGVRCGVREIDIRFVPVADELLDHGSQVLVRRIEKLFAVRYEIVDPVLSQSPGRFDEVLVSIQGDGTQVCQRGNRLVCELPFVSVGLTIVAVAASPMV